MRSFAVIANPISGRGAALRAARVTLRLLEDAGVHVCIHETQGPGDATAWLEGRAGEFEVVVAVGGDGTLRDVIAGVGADATIGLVPTGTANVVSRDLGIPRRPRKAVRVLLSERTRRLDLGCVNGRPFLAMVGVGFDGLLVRSLNEARSGTISMATYLGPGLRTFLSWKGVPLRLEVDGEQVLGPVFGAVISNTRNYGGLFSITPRADLTDGLLDWQATCRPGRWPLLRLALAASFRRELESGLAAYGRGRRFRITADEPVAVQVDGDTFGTTPVSIVIDPGRLQILAPPLQEDPHS